MKIIEKIKDLKDFINIEKKQGRTVGFVPTMGNLHDGHLSLINRSKSECDITVCSIFVNPTQFGKNEDFSKYPRTFEEDTAKLESAKTDFLFFPSVEEMYLPATTQASLDNEFLSKGLCGKYRPSHFSGVLTVVMKLFNIIKPDKAFFGLKDYQQYIIIKNMVQTLNMDIEIIGCPIIRENDGLAMSSRNAYLSSSSGNLQTRIDALTIFKTLNHIKELFQNGETSPVKLKAVGIETITKKLDLQYLEIVDANTLESVTEVKKGNVVAIATYCGTTRLIDNIIL